MIFKMYSIKDELEGFAPVVPFTNEDIAKRYFRTHLEKTPVMASNKSDYSLWYLGTYDSESGTFIQTAKDIRLVMRGE